MVQSNLWIFFHSHKLGHVAQSEACLTLKPEVPSQYLVRPHTSVSPSADSRRAVVSYWQKYVHEVLVNHLGGLSLPGKSVVRLTEHNHRYLLWTENNNSTLPFS